MALVVIQQTGGKRGRDALALWSHTINKEMTVSSVFVTSSEWQSRGGTEACRHWGLDSYSAVGLRVT